MIGSQIKQHFKRVQKTHENVFTFVLFLSHPYTYNVFVHTKQLLVCTCVMGLTCNYQHYTITVEDRRVVAEK